MLESDLAVHRDYIPGNGRYIVTFGAFLVASGDQLVLLDAGLGPAAAADGVFRCSSADDASREAYGQLFRNFGRSEEYINGRLDDLSTQTVEYGMLASSLKAVGVDPRDITDVVFSHLHPDHVGWASADGSSYFSNANLWCHEADAEHFLGERAPDEAHYMAMYGVAPTKDRLLPVMNQLKTWDRDRSVAPGIDLRHVPGHTPGSSVCVISSNGERAIMMGDVVHCPLELTADEWSVMADVDPLLALKSKQALLPELEDGKVHIGSPHFAGLRYGRLLAQDDSRSWVWDEY
jgi:glyoxylase-like metal-dependent hydrolase (beta-lactamase superfamily II)